MFGFDLDIQKFSDERQDFEEKRSIEMPRSMVRNPWNGHKAGLEAGEKSSRRGGKKGARDWRTDVLSWGP